MSEPTLVENVGARDKQQGAGGAAAEDRTQRGGLRSKLRSSTYAEGEQLLQPEAPVQMKPDPKGPAAPKKNAPPNEIDELRKDNQGLRERVTTLEGTTEDQKKKQEEQQKQLDETNARMLMLAEQNIAGRIAELEAELSDSETALASLEGLVEDTLVADDKVRVADDGVQKAIKTHKEEQKPGLLDGLTMMMSIAGALKSGISLIALVRKTTPERATKLEIGMGVVDAVTGAGTAITDGYQLQDKEDKAPEGDSTVGMIQAVDAKVDAVDSGVQALLKHAFGKEKHALGSALSKAVRSRDGIQDTFEVLGDKASATLVNKAKDAGLHAAGTASRVEDKLKRLEELLKARDPNLGGGGELSKGSAGRSVFDLVAGQPKACSLLAEKTLDVQAKRYDAIVTKEERSGFWLRVSDLELQTDLRFQLFPHQVQPFRPDYVTESDMFVPLHIGRPLSTLIKTTDMPYHRVHLTGNVMREWATREEWLTPEGRRELLVHPTYQSKLPGQGAE